MDGYHAKIAQILRVDKRRLVDLEIGLEEATGKTGILKKIAEENEEQVKSHLDFLGLGRNVSALEVYDALISKLEADDTAIFDAMGLFSLRNPDTPGKIVEFIKSFYPITKGFFLKKAKAIEFLEKEPPLKILAALGYKSVAEMMAKEDLFEVYSALRFLEDQDWLNNVFFKQYEDLKPKDFEERTIELRALDKKWAAAAERFVAKKYHNVSHLKELGVIFVIPIFLGISGETLRLISLLLHYLNEVKYYSDLFLESGKDELNFATNLISLLRGDVIDKRLDQGGKIKFLVIQRYLAKDDENDWRLFEPHVNPEAVHWRKAEEGIVQIPEYLPLIKDHLHFWKELDWVGDYFKDEVGKEVLVSFNIVDTVMALVKEKELIKYLYHHQEALWNKIFSSYFGDKKMMEFMQKNMIKGWFEV